MSRLCNSAIDRAKNVLWLIAVLLFGCSPTYWAFPPGRSESDFKVDELRCQVAVKNLVAWSIPSCLSGLGYRQISQDEFLQMQQQARQTLEAALKPMDIAAYDVRTQDIYVGKSETFFDKQASGNLSPRAAISVESLKSNTRCSGQADVIQPTAVGKGSFGSATLLCQDGRVIKAVFTYESARSGYGVGSDNAGNSYRFVFGDLNLDADELRKTFQELVRKFPT